MPDCIGNACPEYCAGCAREEEDEKVVTFGKGWCRHPGHHEHLCEHVDVRVDVDVGGDLCEHVDADLYARARGDEDVHRVLCVGNRHLRRSLSVGRSFGELCSGFRMDLNTRWLGWGLGLVLGLVLCNRSGFVFVENDGVVVGVVVVGVVVGVGVGLVEAGRHSCHHACHHL